MEENVVQIKSGIAIMGKGLYLVSCYMSLWKWEIFSKYYWRRFSGYERWNYRGNKNSSKKL